MKRPAPKTTAPTTETKAPSSASSEQQPRVIEASSAKPAAALDEHYPNVEKKGAQSWERPADFYPAGQTPADELAETLERIRNASEGWGPALGMNADPGDKFSFTI